MRRSACCVVVVGLMLVQGSAAEAKIQTTQDRIRALLQDVQNRVDVTTPITDEMIQVVFDLASQQGGSVDLIIAELRAKVVDPNTRFPTVHLQEEETGDVGSTAMGYASEPSIDVRLQAQLDAWEAANGQHKGRAWTEAYVRVDGSRCVSGVRGRLTVNHTMTWAAFGGSFPFSSWGDGEDGRSPYRECPGAGGQMWGDAHKADVSFWFSHHSASLTEVEWRDESGVWREGSDASDSFACFAMVLSGDDASTCPIPPFAP